MTPERIARLREVRGRRQREAAGLYKHCRIDDATYQRLFFEWGHPKVMAVLYGTRSGVSGP